MLPLIEFLVFVFPLNRVPFFAFAPPPPPSPWGRTSTFDIIIGILGNITAGITSSFNSFPLLQICYIVHKLYNFSEQLFIEFFWHCLDFGEKEK